MLAANGETESALVYVKKADQFDPGNKVSYAYILLNIIGFMHQWAAHVNPFKFPVR